MRATPAATTILRKPDETALESPDAPLEAVAQDLSTAIHAKDIKAIASAIRAAFEIMSSQEPESTETEQE